MTTDGVLGLVPVAIVVFSAKFNNIRLQLELSRGRVHFPDDCKPLRSISDNSGNGLKMSHSLILTATHTSF